MDKWDEAVERIKNGMLAEEPEAALAGALTLFAEFGRTMEMISADMDRIATALEKEEISGLPGPPKYEPPVADESKVHDL